MRMNREEAAVTGWLMAALHDDLFSDIESISVDTETRKIHVVYYNPSFERSELIRKEVEELKKFCKNFGRNANYGATIVKT